MIIFLFNPKKNANDAHRSILETYSNYSINIHYTLLLYSVGFLVSKVVILKSMTMVEDAELEELLDQDSCQMQEELTKTLQVTQTTVSIPLKVLGFIQKQ